jgi:hypothetical protein
MKKLGLLLALGAIGCGRMGIPSEGAPDASTLTGDTGGTCNPPDVLVLLDRTASMAERPNGTFPANTAAGHTESKWFIAINAIESLSTQMETTVRFGLALFPRAPASSEACITLSQRIGGERASNPQCESGEVLVAPAASSADAIGSTLDPESTRLCTSTPIGAGLATARTELESTREASRPQYVLFVGDGADTCDSELALTNTDALARDGVKTFVVAFDNGSPAGVDRGLLNDMACAGQTAAGFPAGCVAEASGIYRAVDRTGPDMFLIANDAAALSGALQQIAQTVCCGCIL